ncbi:MAG: Bax inhibitor-1/YccA family protein [Candidatus Omnitrophica bacterium]|nr:Bax inhibitor-1/YccA family protein [Candidatus Omnitrophota bacterium]
MRSSNPALSDRAFPQAGAVSAGGAMSIQGAVQKTAVLALLALAAAAWAWQQRLTGGAVLLAALVGFGIGIATTLRAAWAPITAPLYALCEGVVLGGLSWVFEASYPGIVIQAVGLTFGTLFALLGAYQSGLVRATENFKLGVVAATGGICLLYLATIILGFFHVSIPGIYGSGWIGIAFSLFVVTIAALNLVLDFDFIEQAAGRGAPKHMEWYAGFGLLVTLVWLYLEFLRLLAKARSRR